MALKIKLCNCGLYYKEARNKCTICLMDTDEQYRDIMEGADFDPDAYRARSDRLKEELNGKDPEEFETEPPRAVLPGDPEAPVTIPPIDDDDLGDEPPDVPTVARRPVMVTDRVRVTNKDKEEGIRKILSDGEWVRTMELVEKINDHFGTKQTQSSLTKFVRPFICGMVNPDNLLQYKKEGRALLWRLRPTFGEPREEKIHPPETPAAFPPLKIAPPKLKIDEGVRNLLPQENKKI